MAVRFRLVWLVAAAVWLVAAPAGAEGGDDEPPKAWREGEVQLPPYPVPENLLPLYVSAATANRFFIDGATLSVGADGVIRYVLVVETPQGARNVTFEGMRCDARARRIYASGRADGSWSRARKDEWVSIQDAYANRQHAALFLEYFCPFGNSVRHAAEARDALVRGGHPDVRR